jgi:indole-3-glycerol phosphate synthase/phosphoribosylanthranilate isomerase
MEHLQQVRRQVNQPVLNKDFFFDPYQVWLGRKFGADAILLMLSVLDDSQWRELASLAGELGMAVLTEVASDDEMERARTLGAKLIGINNRDLHTLQIDLGRTRLLAEKAPPDAVLISESGYRTRGDIESNLELVQGFLIGSSLMSQPDLEMAVRSLLFNVEAAGAEVVKEKQL